MRIVDAHTHVVSHDLARYPLAPAASADNAWQVERPVDVDELLALAAASGVDALALVQAISAHGYDNRYVLDCAVRLPGRTIAVVAVPPDDPRAADALRAMAASAPVHGVRLFTPAGPQAPLDTADVSAVADAAGGLGIPVVLLALAPQLRSVQRLAARHRDVTFVLDHCGFADLSGGPSFPRADDLFALADAPNVVAKVSSIVLRSTADPDDLWRSVVDRFGADRVVWGTDHPHTDGPGYAPLVQLALDSSSVLTDDERAAVFAGTACRVWPSLARV